MIRSNHITSTFHIAFVVLSLTSKSACSKAGYHDATIRFTKRSIRTSSSLKRILSAVSNVYAIKFSTKVLIVSIKASISFVFSLSKWRSCARIFVSGVFKSCDKLAINSRRSFSSRSSCFLASRNSSTI